MAKALDDKERDITLGDVGRSVLNSVVLLSTSLLLLLVSCAAFFLFYHINVPATGVQETAHLQYHHTPQNPFALIDLTFASHALKLSQAYNVIVEMTVPDSPSNHAIGNFMVELVMLATDSSTIVASARPIMLHYTSPLMDTVTTVVKSAPLLLGLREESQTLRVPVLEDFQFQSGWLTQPSQARLEVHAPTLQVYACKVIFETHMQGLPWLLYTFKIPSFFLFTTLFWASSMLCMLLTWATMSFKVLPARSTSESAAAAAAAAVNKVAASVKKESPSQGEGEAKAGASMFPRVPGSRQSASLPARSVATSSSGGGGAETSSIFEFDKREASIKTEATTMDEDPFIKVEEASDTD